MCISVYSNNFFCLFLFSTAPIATPTLETEPNFEPVTDPLLIEPTTLPEAQVGVMYEVKMQITRNVTPVGDMWIKEGALPIGFEFAFLNGEDAAQISGVPEEVGIYNITIYAWCFGTMVAGLTMEKEYQIVVSIVDSHMRASLLQIYSQRSHKVNLFKRPLMIIASDRLPSRNQNLVLLIQIMILPPEDFE